MQADFPFFAIIQSTLRDGVPRNYIVSSTDTLIDVNEAELIRNVKQQKVIVAAGLLSTIIANKNYGVADQLSLQANYY